MKRGSEDVLERVRQLKKLGELMDDDGNRIEISVPLSVVRYLTKSIASVSITPVTVYCYGINVRVGDPAIGVCFDRSHPEFTHERTISERIMDIGSRERIDFRAIRRVLIWMKETSEHKRAEIAVRIYTSSEYALNVIVGNVIAMSDDDRIISDEIKKMLVDKLVYFTLADESDQGMKQAYDLATKASRKFPETLQ